MSVVCDTPIKATTVVLQCYVVVQLSKLSLIPEEDLQYAVETSRSITKSDYRERNNKQIFFKLISFLHVLLL